MLTSVYSASPLLYRTPQPATCIASNQLMVLRYGWLDPLPDEYAASVTSSF
jgi:hypothetical protein